MTHGRFLILAVLHDEVDALLRLFQSKRLVEPPAALKNCYEIYTNDSTSVGILVQLEGIGRLHAALSTAHAIFNWKPKIVLLVGTAGGVKRNGVALGDIIIATEILDYEPQRLGVNGPTIRLAEYKPDPSLLEFARQMTSPNDSLTNSRTPVSFDFGSIFGDKSPRVHFGPIFSGDKVIASNAALDQLLKIRSGALGVEMEGAGVALATAEVSVPMIMVRGVASASPRYLMVA